MHDETFELVPGPSATVWLPMDLHETKAKIAQIHREGTAPETIRAIRDDLRYFWSWADISFGISKPAYPVPVEVVEAFISDHIKGLGLRVENAMLSRGSKKKPGPHKFSTVRRRVSSLAVAHDVQGLAYEKNPCRSFRVKKLLQNARKSAIINGERPKQRAPITLEILGRMLQTCQGKSLTDKRDVALLLFGWATGGRRRAEIAGAICEHLTARGDDYLYFMPESKGDREKQGVILPVCGLAAQRLTDWIVAAEALAGPIFRQIDRHGNVGVGLSGHAVNLIIKDRAARAGLDPDLYGGHSLRAGFSTECGLQGITLENQMMLTTHKNVQTAVSYRRPGDVLNNPAARLVDRLAR
ncbi:site-specific integrase [Desulfurivibrio sp. D14AmB]|uniref:site-specific integrase n=1 Tax=Desulfurivibrio sp. D14AmB TaxID=3374370 RepID=UPI00376F245D